MSKSFSLVNGDLYISGRSFELVSARDKLIQDLSLWLRERIGTDSATPEYGSTLDGGVVDGKELPPYIGRLLNPMVESEITAEVYSLVLRYQKEQLEKIKEEAILYNGRNTLEQGEIIDSIESVSLKNLGTTVLIKVTLNTMSNSELTFILPINTGL